MITSTEVQLARVADGEAIAEMSRSLIETGLSWSWTPSRVRGRIRDPESNVVVVRSATGLAGFAAMQYLEEDAHLLLLAVNPAFRRQGVGRRMLDWHDQVALVAGIGRIRLEVRVNNYSGQAFYRNLGYRTVKLLPSYYSGRESALRMARELSPVRTGPLTDS